MTSLYAADYALLVLEGDVLHMIRLNPADAARASERILGGERPGDVLGEAAYAVPLGELRSLRGMLLGRDLEVRWGKGRDFKADFADRKTRDGALEGIAAALGVEPGVEAAPRSIAMLLFWASWIGIGLISGWAYWVKRQPASLAGVGMGGVGVLRLLYDVLHPPRRRVVGRI